MRTLLLQPFAGIAGDMMVGALLDAGADTPEFWEGLRSLPLPAHEWSVSHRTVVKCGISSCKFQVEFTEHAHHHHHDHDHHHHGHSHGRHLPEIVKIINGADLPDTVKAQSIAVFDKLAEAESEVHAISKDKVHFHEVGAVDAIADIVGACLGLHVLGVDRVISSPVAVGSGTVKCAHGILPVPPPAVVNLLRGIPTTTGSVTGELTTPTGAALLATLVDDFSGQISGTLIDRGYGAADRDYDELANVLQVLLYENADPDATETTIAVLECNLDDMPGERFSYITPLLLEAGALDVTLIPCTMKKGRPGVVLQVMASLEKRTELTDLILRETTTFGVRWYQAERHVLRRESRVVTTPYGEISVKLGYATDGSLLRIAPEYESCRAAAEATEASLDVIYDAAKSAITSSR